MSAPRGSVLAGEEPEEEDTTPQPVKKEVPVAKTAAAVVGEGEEPEEDETPVPTATMPATASSSLSSLEKYEQEKLARGIKFESSGSLTTSAALPSRGSTEAPAPAEEVSSSIDAAVLKQLHPMERSIVSKNENIRKTLATALIHLYSHVNTSLVQVSVETTNTLNFTQDISHQLSETNDDLIQLQSKIPACTAWVNSFLAPAT